MGRMTALLATLAVCASAGLFVRLEASTSPQEAPKQEPAKPEPPQTEPAKDGQEQPKPPGPAEAAGPQPAPPQDDKAPITGVVETWMRIIQGGEHRGGYLHERINPVSGRLYRYDYLSEGDYDLTERLEGEDTQTTHVSWTISATLTESFEPYQVQASSTKGDVQWIMELKTIEDKRHIQVTLPAAAGRAEAEVLRAELPEGEPFGLSAPLILYKLRQRGELAKPGEIEAKLMGASAGGTVGLSISVEPAILKKIVGDKPSFVTPVTLSNVPGLSDLPLPIDFFFKSLVDKHGRIIEAYSSDEDTKLELATDATEARGSEFTLAQRGRRDPFSNRGALTRLGPGGEPVTPAGEAGRGETGTFRPEAIGQELERAGKMVANLEELVKNANPKAEKVYQDFLKLYEQLRVHCKGEPVKLNQLDSYKVRAEAAYGGADKLVKRAQKLLQDIEDYYNAYDEKGVDETVRKIKELRSRREFFQDELSLEMDRIVKLAEGKLAQTKARVELRAKTLVLTGTVSQWNVVKERVDFDLAGLGAWVGVHEPIRISYNVTYAVINDKLYREKEEVEGQGVVVERIQPHGITVAYKGEVREVGLKKR